jgi:hypothetical protein
LKAFADRAHFFSAAAEAMRRILVERARRKCAGKRGGGEAKYVDVEEVEIAAPEANDEQMLAVHEALDGLGRTPLEGETREAALFRRHVV